MPYVLRYYNRALKWPPYKKITSDVTVGVSKTSQIDSPNPG